MRGLFTMPRLTMLGKHAELGCKQGLTEHHVLKSCILSSVPYVEYNCVKSRGTVRVKSTISYGITNSSPLLEETVDVSLQMISQSISPQVIHLVAGGCGGTVGAVITCPLEVVKTRLQSSKASIKFLPTPNINVDGAVTHVSRRSLGVFQSLKTICIEEGGSALFRGLGPNLVGIAPSRAIYFGAYASAKNFLNTKLEPESSMVHLLSAACGGFISSTCTNPIWLIKTRLQLEHRNGRRYTNTWRAIKTVYSHEGLRGFYRGVTASYVGISETMIHFVIYERIKKFLREQRAYNSDLLSPKDFLTFMGAAATSKSIAATIAYPHEVARTRLREEGTKYRTFFQTLSTVLREEGFRGCYGGLVAHLARQIPNTAIVLVVYELVVYSLNKL